MRQPFSRPLFSLAFVVAAGALAAQAPAVQAPAPPAQAPATPPRPPRIVRHDYPVRPPGDPVRIAHGKQVFGANCSFCHGSDARGGETGPNLVRSEMVLDDKDGEGISSVILNGRISKGMPAFPLSAADITDIAQFLHAQTLSSQAGPPSAPIDILVGDEAAGKAYFNGAGKCANCHSVTGNLAGIGSRFEPKQLQNAIVSGAGPRGFGEPMAPITATVKLPSGQQYKGTLNYRDAFFVTLTDADGTRHSFPVDAPGTTVEVHNPLQAHMDMFATWKDSDIHNLTKYLSTLK